jgi:hypothetical protein
LNSGDREEYEGRGIEVQGNLLLKGNSEGQREESGATVKRSVFALVVPFIFTFILFYFILFFSHLSCEFSSN